MNDAMPIPVLLLTGFLGAGKTTLVNRLLKFPDWAEQRLALVINEFGTLGVDGRLIPSGKLRKYEINRGSIFCTCTKIDFLSALEKIAEGPRCEMVVIEATGIAETGGIEEWFRERPIAGRFSIRANLCLVDAANFTKVVAFLRPAKIQVEEADALVINKVDLVRPTALKRLGQLLAELNPEAPRALVEHGAITPEFLAGLSHTPLRRRARGKAPAEIVSLSFQTRRTVDRTAFLEVIHQLGSHLLRLKGNIEFASGTRYVEFAGDELTESAGCPSLSAHTAFTLIAWKVDREELGGAIEACWRAKP